MIKKLGPLAGFSTIRCEGKHKMLKMTANVCSSCVKLALTVATKQQLALCYRLTCNESILSSKLVVGTGNFTNLQDLPVYPFLKKMLPKENISESDYFFVPKWVEYKGSVFKPKMILLVGFDPEFGNPIFGEIDFVLVHNDQPLFVYSALSTIRWYSHVRGFEVEESINKSPACVAADSLYSSLPLSIYKMRSGQKIVFPKYCNW